jgi:hypothetical protein
MGESSQHRPLGWRKESAFAINELSPAQFEVARFARGCSGHVTRTFEVVLVRSWREFPKNNSGKMELNSYKPETIITTC